MHVRGGNGCRRVHRRPTDDGLLCRDERELAAYTFCGLTDRHLIRLSSAPPNGREADTLLASPSQGEVPSVAFAKGSIVADKYEIEHILGQGGIGVVVVAKHLALNKRVAIKYLKPKALSNESIVQRFVREARLTAQITSEHTVRVHDVGTLLDGGPYMVMEYLVGEDLGQVLRTGSLPIERAVDYILQACDALAEAHSLRIVHRDIKPENLFLAQRATHVPILKVIDFGISKAAIGAAEDGKWARETAVGERFGTPLYMSPEQLRATGSVDHRTDIWSLGVVLHELLVGSAPFEGDDLPRLCASILTAPPIRISTIRPSVPTVLESIVLRCLEKDPQRRFRNVAEFAQELAAFGPPSSDERVSRIREMIRHGGDSVDPPAPPFSGARLASPDPAPLPPTVGERSASTMQLRFNRLLARRKGIERGALFGSAVVVLVGIAGAIGHAWAPAGQVAQRQPWPAPSPSAVELQIRPAGPRTGDSATAPAIDEAPADSALHSVIAGPRADLSPPSPPFVRPRVPIPPASAGRHIDRRRSEFGERR